MEPGDRKVLRVVFIGMALGTAAAIVLLVIVMAMDRVG